MLVSTHVAPAASQGANVSSRRHLHDQVEGCNAAGACPPDLIGEPFRSGEVDQAPATIGPSRRVSVAEAMALSATHGSATARSRGG
jgi:hypothetical protein